MNKVNEVRVKEIEELKRETEELHRNHNKVWEKVNLDVTNQLLYGEREKKKEGVDFRQILEQQKEECEECEEDVEKEGKRYYK